MGTMRSIVYREYGGPEVLEIADVEKPTPDAGEVLVEVEAAGVNPTETYPREGHGTAELPRTPGGDVAGRVSAVGPGVTSFAVGDRVFGTGLQNGQQGTYAEFVPAPVDLLATLPEGVTYSQGAAIGVVGVTAWRAIVDYGAVSPADVVLVHGGSGGVGHLAVQLGHLAGGRVLSTAGTESARDRVREFGADVVFDYARGDLAEAIDGAAPDGVDVVVDHRVGEYVGLDVDVAATGGTIVGIGPPTAACEIDDLWSTLTKDLTVQFMSMSNTPDTSDVLDRLASLLESGRITVAIDREMDLADAAAAHRALESEHVVGKLVLQP